LRKIEGAELYTIVRVAQGFSVTDSPLSLDTGNDGGGRNERKSP
jgi:hypothetical protein